MSQSDTVPPPEFRKERTQQNEFNAGFNFVKGALNCSDGLSLRDRNICDERYAREAPDPDYQ
jgi:hypothetical protein